MNPAPFPAVLRMGQGRESLEGEPYQYGCSIQRCALSSPTGPGRMMLVRTSRRRLERSPMGSQRGSIQGASTQSSRRPRGSPAAIGTSTFHRDGIPAPSVDGVSRSIPLSVTSGQMSRLNVMTHIMTYIMTYIVTLIQIMTSNANKQSRWMHTMFSCLAIQSVWFPN